MASPAKALQPPRADVPYKIEGEDKPVIFRRTQKYAIYEGRKIEKLKSNLEVVDDRVQAIISGFAKIGIEVWGKKDSERGTNSFLGFFPVHEFPKVDTPYNI